MVVISSTPSRQRTLLFLVRDDWYFASHRLPLAKAAAAIGFRVVVATAVDRHGEALRAAGCEVIAVPAFRARGLAGRLAVVWQVIRLYRDVRPDVAHHVALLPIVVGGIARRFCGTRHIIDAIAGRGFVFTSTSLKARALRPLLLLALRFGLARPRGGSVHTIVQNADDGHFLLQHNLARKSEIVLVPGVGVDLRAFVPVEPPGGTPVVILAARMLWDKGINEFVQAARILRQRGVPARLVLIGASEDDGPRWVPTAQLENWSVEGIIEWWGQRTEMPSILGSSHVVALPTAYGEGVPKILLEAAASGRPIVTTDVAGCRDVVRQNDNGILIPPHDALALANAIERLVKDAPLRRRMGQRGRARAESDFSIEDAATQTLSLYGPAHRELG